MARTIGIIVVSLLAGILIGGISTHFYQRHLWRHKVAQQKLSFFGRGFDDDLRKNKIPPDLLDELRADLHLPEAELAAKIEALPFYQQFTLDERAKFMERLIRLRKKQAELADEKINRLGLPLSDEQKTAFKKSMIEKQTANIKVVKAKSKEMLQELDQKTDEDLRQEFSTTKP